MSKQRRNSAEALHDAPIPVTPRVLRGWPLPQPDANGDKEARGCVLVVGGDTTLPGAPVLSGTAALRAGAGKLQIATCRSNATAVGVAVPEAMVCGLQESENGGIDPGAAEELGRRAAGVHALLIGPGMMDEEATSTLLRNLLPSLGDTALILDAGALAVLRDQPEALHTLKSHAIVTPHAGEIAGLLGIDKETVEHDPHGIARRAAEAWRAVVALKGSTTYIVEPGGTTYCYVSGTIGLATSGSGDTLAGIVAGLAARGAEPAQAAAWGVFLHGRAGAQLTKRMGRLGFLARELPVEIPALMAQMEGRHDD